MATPKVTRQMCSRCEKEAEFEVLSKRETLNVRNEPIEVEVEYLQCGECGDEVLDPTHGDDPFVKAYEEYRKRHGLLMPGEIAKWRKSLGLTQGELAKVIGIGTATISRYENGSLQDEAHEKLLRMAMQPAGLLHLVEKSEDVFTPDQKARLVRALRDGSAESCTFDNAIQWNLGDYPPDEFNGYKKLDLAKFYNMVLFFCRNGIWKTKLNKLLFYADFKHFKEYAVPITGARYAHIPFGPVPDNYEIYFASLLTRGALQVQEELFSDGHVGEKLKTEQRPDISIFSASELRIMASVAERFEAFGAKEIAEYSHQEAGYRDTENGELISYAYAAKLRD